MNRYIINWRVEGAWECDAKDADEAQAKFDKAWGSPRGVRIGDGEVSNDKPEPVDTPKVRREARP